MTLGKVIKTLIKNRGLKQYEMAEALGTSISHLARMLADEHHPTKYSLAKISKVLKVPVPVLYFMCLEKDDIPEDKKESFVLMKPFIDDFLNDVFKLEKDLTSKIKK